MLCFASAGAVAHAGAVRARCSASRAARAIGVQTRRATSSARRLAAAMTAGGPGGAEQKLKPVEWALLVLCGIAVPAVSCSVFQVARTGCGLPPGPYGLFGAAEGLGFLTLAALVGYSIRKKFSTGSGLVPGPYGLLGAAEGMAYLLLLVYIGEYTYYSLVMNAPPGGPQCY